MAERSDQQLLEALLASSERLETAIAKLTEISCRQNDATVELARRKRLHAESEKRSRVKRKSQNDATECGQSDPTLQVVKAVASQERDQEQENYLQRDATLTPQTVTPRPKPATGPVWLAYSTAYEARYGAQPVRNAKVNGQLAQFVRRVPEANAPEVAAFYVGHSGAYYGQRGHCVDALLRDAEKLHTEWETGKQITGTSARQHEKTAANRDGWTSLLKEPKNGVG